MSLRGLLISLLLGGLLACGDAPPARHVVLITLDTVRADHLSLYGYARPTTPRLEQLAASASVYERAMASAPWTMPSHASLFTGLDPSQHGVVSYVPTSDADIMNAYPLAPERRTLAEALRDEGFATAAFVGNAGFLGRRTGLDQGFDTYHVEQRYADVLNLRAQQWLADHRHEPFFLFLNYIDAHVPFNTQPRPGVVEGPVPRGNDAIERFRFEVMQQGLPVDEGLRARVVNQYDTGIAHADAAVGALVDRLKLLGLWDDTLFIVTSDHGDFLGEHGYVGHSKDVFQEVMWVPLLVRAPGQTRGRRVDTPISITDIPSIVAESLAEPARGRLAAEFPARRRPVLAENHYSRWIDSQLPEPERFARVRRAIYDWPWKYIESSDGNHELYDLSRDPGEARNRIGDEPEIAARLAGRLSERGPAADASRVPPRPTPEDIEALRALGYVDSP